MKHSDAAEDRKLIRAEIKKAEMSENESAEAAPKPKGRMGMRKGPQMRKG